MSFHVSPGENEPAWRDKVGQVPVRPIKVVPSSFCLVRFLFREVVVLRARARPPTDGEAGTRDSRQTPGAAIIRRFSSRFSDYYVTAAALFSLLSPVGTLNNSAS